MSSCCEDRSQPRRKKSKDCGRRSQTSRGERRGASCVRVGGSQPHACGLNATVFPFSRQQGRSETEEYSSDSESESEDEEELQMILEDLQKQNEELEVGRSHLFTRRV